MLIIVFLKVSFLLLLVLEFFFFSLCFLCYLPFSKLWFLCFLFIFKIEILKDWLDVLCDWASSNHGLCCFPWRSVCVWVCGCVWVSPSLVLCQGLWDSPGKDASVFCHEGVRKVVFCRVGEGDWVPHHSRCRLSCNSSLFGRPPHLSPLPCLVSRFRGLLTELI